MPFRLPTPVLVALIALAVAVLVALGVWQLQRNAWRERAVADRNARIVAAPLAVEAAARLPPAAVDYRPVTAPGTWDHARAMVLGNRIRFGTKGEEIVEPLLLAPGGPAVLVNRGWYPAGERDRALAGLAQRDGEPAQGLARYVEWLGGKQTTAGTWTQISPRDMGATLPYAVLPWYVVEGQLLPERAGHPSALPAQGFFAYASTTPHLQYALTWFGLAAALVTVAVLRFVVAPRRERARGQPPPRPDGGGAR
ncbi:MAG: SURF1 family protein [Dehalococcoidia bacterium]|nr:SURF1 family protein [Dehalococcoidia bacterium]